MIEALVAAAVLGVLLGVGLAHRFVDWLTLLRVGAYTLVAGSVTSILGGLVYHIMLYRALHKRGSLRHGWWWNPTDYHAALQPHQRSEVLPWFYLGAVGFCIVMVGCVGLLLAIWRV